MHHCKYERGKEPWDYAPRSLVTLCASCHQGESEIGYAGRNAFIKALSAKGIVDSCFLSCIADLEAADFGFMPDFTLIILVRTLREPSLRQKMEDAYFSFQKEERSAAS